MSTTYFLGAGASANALPTYGNFKHRLMGFNEFIKLKYNEVSPFYKEKCGRLNNALRDAVKQLIEEMEWHSTPDTVAKKFFHLQKDDELRLLKACLLVFFIFEQSANQIWEYKKDEWKFDPAFKRPLDPRYDALIAAILKPSRGLRIANQFSILTWNYDYQFELSYARYNQKGFRENHEDLNVYPSFGFNHDRELALNDFSICHINGLAYYINEQISKLAKGPYKIKDYPIDDLFYLFNGLIGNSQDGIPKIDEIFYFAWETKEKHQQRENLMKENLTLANIARRTETLVVIGYSYPIFNREIDYAIFQEMRDLKKVIIQSFEPDNLKSILTSFYFKANGTLPPENYFTIIPPESGFYVPIDIN